MSIVEFEEYIPHEVSETICVFCGNRALRIYPEVTPLRILECDNCLRIGGIIKTGQDLDYY